MITFDEIARLLEVRLNGVDYANIKSHNLDGISNPSEALVPNERYEFKIFTDTGVYQRAERDRNTVKRFINGIMSVIGNDVEGTSANNYTAVVQTKVDFLIPFAEGADENDRNTILSAVRQVITAALQYTNTESVDDSDGISYLYVINYALANSGSRAQMNEAGDAFTLSVFINHSFVTMGVASSEYEFRIVNNDGEHLIPYQKYGMARKCTFDTNTDNSLNAVNTPTSTVLTINFDLYKRISDFDEAIDAYLFECVLSPITIRVTRLNDNKSHKYTMYIDTGALNGAVGAIASSSVTLVTALTL